MMTSVSGARGVGKTYHLAKKVYEHYLDGFLCITNFSHAYSHIDVSKSPPGTLLKLIKEIGQFKQAGYEICDLLPTFKHSGIFIAVDEAHLTFSADQHARYRTNPDFQFIIQFLAQARKQDVNIWYACQTPDKIDKNWRRYTEFYVNYVPAIPLRVKVLKKHPSRPIFRREIRYVFPLVWEEWHELDAESPHFNYSRKYDEDGFSSWSRKSTLIKRRLVRSGYLDPFPYKLYDSYQTISLGDVQPSDYPLLRGISFVPHTFKPEKFPTFKKWSRALGINWKSTDEKIPTRLKFEEIKLPTLETNYAENVLKQPEQFLADISIFNREKGRNALRFRSSK